MTNLEPVAPGEWLETSGGVDQLLSGWSRKFSRGHVDQGDNMWFKNQHYTKHSPGKPILLDEGENIEALNRNNKSKCVAKHEDNPNSRRAFVKISFKPKVKDWSQEIYNHPPIWKKSVLKWCPVLIRYYGLVLAVFILEWQAVGEHFLNDFWPWYDNYLERWL